MHRKNADFRRVLLDLAVLEQVLELRAAGPLRPEAGPPGVPGLLRLGPVPRIL